MIDLFLRYAPDPAADAELRRQVQLHIEALVASANRSDRDQVAAAEAVVQADPKQAFTFDATGHATLTAHERTWHAGRFETPSIATLRQRAAQIKGATPGRVRLWAWDGASPATDIGGLQATAGDNTLFQVASQFNCLEAPSAYIVPVAEYFYDSTQGPRASISAFPATLLRHYAVPGASGERFVQQNGGRQINLLEDVLTPDVGRVETGYLKASGVRNPHALVHALESRFEAIRLGVHDAAQVVLGYNWDGAVQDSERRRIVQVFTSTVAGGGYGGLGRDAAVFTAACRQLLRAAYLGTLLAAVTLGKTRVLLTLIGGGVFANPIEQIWDAILWAVDEIDTLKPGELDVIVNGYNLGRQIDRNEILAGVRPRGGLLATFDRTGLVSIDR